jgi:hypothetical protein
MAKNPVLNVFLRLPAPSWRHIAGDGVQSDDVLSVRAVAADDRPHPPGAERITQDAFTHDALEFVRALADQAALAIGNTQRYNEQVRQRELLSSRAPHLAHDLTTALARWLMLVVTKTLAWLLVFAGFLALILPGVFAAVCLLLLRPVTSEAPPPLGAAASSLPPFSSSSSFAAGRAFRVIPRRATR